MTNTFAVGTRVVTGLGSLATLPDQLMSLIGGPTVLIADRGLSDVGGLEKLFAVAPELERQCVVLIAGEPSLADAEAAADQALTSGATKVVAVGGGSALCAAKAVAIRLTNPGPLADYEGVDRVPRPAAPTIAIPTTAGSGSEVSNALVLHEPGGPRETIIRGDGCEPTIAILDADLMTELPRSPMLYAALDALSHAIEALWTRQSSPFTESLAVSAVETILADLPCALDTREPAVLQRLLEASCAANLACGNTGLGLVHALSSAPSVRLTHGHQNGALLLHVGQFNRDVMEPRHIDYLELISGLFQRVGFPGEFVADELGPDALDAMVTAARSHPFQANNRRDSSDDDLVAILHAAGVSG